MKTTWIVFTLIGVVFALPSADRELRVVGGRPALPHEAPYVVSLQVDRVGEGNFTHTCGGSILTEMWILSAAHCISPQFEYQIVAGQHDFDDETGHEQVRSVSERLLHEQFVAGPMVGPFDVALLRLESPLEFVTGIVSAIRLPPAGTIFSGASTLFGWGSTSSTTTPSFPSILHTVTKPIIQWDLCREIVDAVFAHEPLHASNLCTEPLDANLSACNG